MEDMFTITLQTLEEDIEQMTIDVQDQVEDKTSITNKWADIYIYIKKLKSRKLCEWVNYSVHKIKYRLLTH